MTVECIFCFFVFPADTVNLLFFVLGIGFSKKHRPRKRMAAMLAQSEGSKVRKT